MHFGNDDFISSENFAEISKPVHLITFKKFFFQAYFFHSDKGLMGFVIRTTNSFKSMYFARYNTTRNMRNRRHITEIIIDCEGRSEEKCIHVFDMKEERENEKKSIRKKKGFQRVNLEMSK